MCPKSPLSEHRKSTVLTSVDSNCNNTLSPESIAPSSSPAGMHYIADFWGCSDLDNTETIENALVQAADIAGAVLLHVHVHKFSGEGGVTGVALLAESHISVHTWPEFDYAAFDVFMCGDALPQKAIERLKSIFHPKRVELKEIPRGQ